MSFGEEAEEDEEESTRENEKFVGKGKSTHDVLDDPKLSKQVDKIVTENSSDEDEEAQKQEQLESIRKKLKTSHKKQVTNKKPSTLNTNDDDDKVFEDYLNCNMEEERKKKV